MLFFPSPFSHLLPEINFFLFPKSFIVRRQLLVHPPHRLNVVLACILSKFSTLHKVDIYPSSYLSFDIMAAPKAPIIPAMSGLMALTPLISSKALNMASL